MRNFANEVLVDDSAAMVSAQTDIMTPESSISPLTKKRDRNTKIDGIPKQAYLKENKHGMSSRCLTELATAFHSLQGTPLNQLNLSFNTTRRKANTRLPIATHTLKNQLNESNTTLYALHWDGKLIKSVMHTGNDIERVAILLTG